MGKIKDKIAGVASGKKTHKTFGETVGGRAFPDATETKLPDILNVQILVLDAAFKAMQFGEVAILLFAIPTDPTPTKYSCLVGGEVVRRKVKEAQEKKLLPLLGTIVHDEVYYDIV